jgi:1-acyl-sn-glycerol-3-phosphate acyltransferase
MQKKILNVFKVGLAFFLITIMGVVGAILRIVSVGYLTNFNRMYWVPIMSNITLFCIGIRVDNRLPAFDFKEPHFVTFNHNSLLDGFILMMIGLPNSLVLLSEKMMIYIPITLAAWSINVQFVPNQHQTERRLNFFKRLTEKGKKMNAHIIGSSEGVSVNFNQIGRFNRGVYHMALVNKMPVAAIYIYTPTESNPSGTFKPIKNGTLRMELLDIFPTEDWKLENLETHINTVRQVYVQKFNSVMEVQTT